MLRKFKNKKGFTLVELMIVVAILGILAAIAIPQYLDYMKSSKVQAVRDNYDAAVRLVRNELAKRNIPGQDATTDVVGALNSGNKHSPWDSTANAFIAGAIANAGQVVISVTDLSRASGVATGGTVTVDADANGNTVVNDTVAGPPAIVDPPQTSATVE